MKSGTIVFNSYEPTGTPGSDTETEICGKPNHKIYGTVSLRRIRKTVDAWDEVETRSNWKHHHLLKRNTN
jgi:hypothetical protein